jgi:aspartokinase
MELDTRIYTISVSASGNNITILIDQNKAHTILKALHKKFLKEEECSQ